MFDIVRKWAYKAIRDYWFGSYESWLSAVNQAVSEAWKGIESGFSKTDHDYLLSERRATAKSIAKWTWRNVTPASFELFVAKTHQPHLQRARQAKSVESRLIKTQDKRDQARELKESGVSVTEIARLLEISRPTIYKWLA